MINKADVSGIYQRCLFQALIDAFQQVTPVGRKNSLCWNSHINMEKKTAVGKVFDPMWAQRVDCREDRREISLGLKIPTKYYADQPYFTKTLDGGLLCVVTTGQGHEGARGQHVLSMKTFDLGKTWRHVTPVEDPENPESSWGVPFTAPGGRVFVFYVFNAEDLRDLPADNPPYPNGLTQRMDSHGYYVFRWSDDHGITWSKDRGTIPVREFEIDRQNPTKGKVRLFWNVGKAFSWHGSLFLPIHKVGGFGDGWFTSTEGGLLRSDDLLTVSDPLKASWITHPDGDRGIRTPEGGGPIAEEHSFVPLSDGTFFTVFRTIDGHPACAYSRDQGQSWEPSQYMLHMDGRLMKHPRAANFVWKMSDGGYLYCFNNHGGAPLREHPQRRTIGYNGRNPMWLCRGWEVDGANGKMLKWSEPEIALYDDDPLVRISYPDCFEESGKIFLSETQKSVGRIHELSSDLADALSASPERRGRTLLQTKPILEWLRGESGFEIPMPPLPAFVARSLDGPYGSLRTRKGFSLDLALRVERLGECTLVQNRGKDGSGLKLSWSSRRTLQLWMSDGITEIFFESSEPLPEADSPHRLTLVVDGGSCTVCFYHDGVLCNGGDSRQYGWGRINPYFRNEYAGPLLAVEEFGPALVDSLTFYGRTLTSAEITILHSRGSIPKSDEHDAGWPEAEVFSMPKTAA